MYRDSYYKSMMAMAQHARTTKHTLYGARSVSLHVASTFTAVARDCVAIEPDASSSADVPQMVAGAHVAVRDGHQRDPIYLHTAIAVAFELHSVHECERCERRYMPSASDAVLGIATRKDGTSSLVLILVLARHNTLAFSTTAVVESSWVWCLKCCCVLRRVVPYPS